MHLSEFDLRAYHDGELPPSEAARTADHLAKCAGCQVQLAEIERRAGRVSAVLDVLAPSPIEAPRSSATEPGPSIGFEAQPDAMAQAWRKFEQQLQEKPSMSNLFLRLRALWVGLAAVIIVAIALSLPSVQALASGFLSLFRVQQVAVLPLDMTNIKDSRYDPSLGQTISQIISDQVKFTRKPAKSQDVADAAEASKVAGFSPRLSTNPTQSLSRLMVQPGMAFEGTFNQSLAEQVLQSMGKSDLTLPAGLNGAVIKVNVPDAITAAYGKCRYNTNPENSSASGGPSLGIGDKCLLLIQLLSPTVDTPPDLPITRLAEIGLQVLGTAPDQAAKIAQSINWTTTLVIPIPRGQMDSKTVTVDNEQGSLLIQHATEGNTTPGYTLVWAKNGMVYAVVGSGDPANGIALGNSLQ
jgi:anti-sigma factor RsiW